MTFTRQLSTLGIALLVVACGDAKAGRPVDGEGGGGSGGASTSATGGSGTGGVDLPPPDFTQATRTQLAEGRDFGRAVDIDQDRIALGTLQTGADPRVYIYRREGTGWTQEAMLVPEAFFQYDMDVDLGGDHLAVVGEYEVSLFSRTGMPWQTSPTSVTASIGLLNAAAVDEGQLAVSPASAFEAFTLTGDTVSMNGRIDLPIEVVDSGCSVDVDGDTAIVGTCVDPMSVAAPGHAYVFRRNGASWSYQQTLTPNDGLMLFGTAVALDGDTAVVGGIEAAYVFARDENGVWHQSARLEPQDTEAKGFGAAVDVSGKVVLVGAPETLFEISTFDVECGATYVFARDGAQWQQQVRLEPEMPEFHTGFGRTLAIEGKTIVIGEVGHELVNIFTAP